VIEVRQARRSLPQCGCGSGRLACVEIEWDNGRSICCRICGDALYGRLLSVGWQGGAPNDDELAVDVPASSLLIGA